MKLHPTAVELAFEHCLAGGEKDHPTITAVGIVSTEMPYFRVVG